MAVTPASSSSVRAVREREERVRGGDRARGPGLALELARLVDGAAAGVHAAHLPAAQPDEHAVADEQDRVRDDAAAQAPGEVEVGALAIARCALA